MNERNKRRDRQIEKEGKTKTEGEGILWYGGKRGKMQAGGRAKEKREIVRVRKKKRRDEGRKVRNEEQ